MYAFSIFKGVILIKKDNQLTYSKQTIFIVEEWYKHSNDDNELITYRVFKNQEEAQDYKIKQDLHNFEYNTDYTTRFISVTI